MIAKHVTGLPVAWRVVITALSLGVGACGSSGGTAGSGSGGGGALDSDGGGAAAGAGGSANGGKAQLGRPCTDDASCEDGLRCLTPLFAGSDRYCGSPCDAASSDCKTLEATSYTFQVPLQYTPFLGDPRTNGWNSEYLGRGTACGPIGGKDGEPRFCQFFCPDLSAAVVENGTITGCKCLPGYKLNDDQSGCVPDATVQCSIFSYMKPEDLTKVGSEYGIQISPVRCDACNSDMSSADTINCHTGRFICDLRNDQLDGACREVFSSSELDGCINSQVYQTCDCQCPTVDACGGQGSSTDCACCTCTSLSSPPPRPVCTTSGTGGSTGTSTGGSGNGGTSGGGGGTGGTSGGGGGTGGTSGGGGGTGGTSGGGGGTGGTSGGGGGTGGASCTAAPVRQCGTDSSGTTPCPSGQICCLSRGCATAANPYTANGSVSSCMTPVAASSLSDRCPSPDLQLCATNTDCGAGYHCDPALYFCIQG